MSDVRQCDHCKRVAAVDDPCWLQLGKAKPQPTMPGLFQGYGYGGHIQSHAGWLHLCSWVCVMDYANLHVLDPAPKEAP